jgi:hypothetical protein
MEQFIKYITDRIKELGYIEKDILLNIDYIKMPLIEQNIVRTYLNDISKYYKVI